MSGANKVRPRDKECGRIYEGDVVRGVPGKPEPHVVKKGETLSGIAGKDSAQVCKLPENAHLRRDAVALQNSARQFAAVQFPNHLRGRELAAKEVMGTLADTRGKGRIGRIEGVS